MQLREFHQISKLEKTRIWRIAVEGDQVTIEYGEEGGAIQKVVDTAKAKNVGKANEVSAEEAAQQMADREILMKCRNGYIEVGDEAEREVEVNFSALPTNLTFYKPDNTLSGALIKKLEAKKVWLSRKRDGECMIISIPEDGVPIVYSRKMLPTHDKEDIPWAARFRHIADALLDRIATGEIPTKTILLGEMVMDRDGGNDDRWHVARVLKSLTTKAIQVQVAEGFLSYYIWDIAFWRGEDFVKTRTVAERYDLIHEVFGKMDHVIPVDFLYADDLEEISDEEIEAGETYSPSMGLMWNRACHLAHVSGWEGWVVVDPIGVYGESGYNFRGKTDRPGKFCGKLKPEFEGDFVAFWDPVNKIGEYGSGKYQGLVGAVELYQYNTKGGLVYVCQCGNGFDEAFLKKYDNPADWPMVLKIKYTSRTYVSNGDKTNALQFPAYLEVRTDKTAEECVEARL